MNVTFEFEYLDIDRPALYSVELFLEFYVQDDVPSGVDWEYLETKAFVRDKHDKVHRIFNEEELRMLERHFEAKHLMPLLEQAQRELLNSI